MMTKQAAEAALQKLAASQEQDAAAAFELGFAKVAADMGLTDAQYAQFYAAGLEKLEAAEKAKQKA